MDFLKYLIQRIMEFLDDRKQFEELWTEEQKVFLKNGEEKISVSNLCCIYLYNDKKFKQRALLEIRIRLIYPMKNVGMCDLTFVMRKIPGLSKLAGKRILKFEKYSNGFSPHKNHLEWVRDKVPSLSKKAEKDDI